MSIKTSVECYCWMLGGCCKQVSSSLSRALTRINSRVRMNSFLLSWGIHVLLSLDVDAFGPWTFHFDLGLHSTGPGNFGFLLKWQHWLSGQLIKGPFCPYHYFSHFCVQNHFQRICLYPVASASSFLGSMNKQKQRLSCCGDSWQWRTFIFSIVGSWMNFLI